MIAAGELGIEEVPIIRLDELTDEQRKAYALVHNKLTMNSQFDFSLLQVELEGIENFDMTDFGFSDFEMGEDNFEADPYDRAIEKEYGENGLISYNVIISCMNDEEKNWLVGLLKEEGALRRLYDCSVIMERYGD